MSILSDLDTGGGAAAELKAALGARERELAEAREELRQSLAQQAATADVLKVISRSAFDLQPVFETVAESAVRLCEADRAFVLRFDGEFLRSVVAHNAPPELETFIRENPIRPSRQSAAGRAAFERQTVHIADVTVDPEYTFKSKDVAPLRTVLAVPMLKGDALLGVILTYRLEVKPFTGKQIALVESFADQAVIAIENVRLFDAEQQRTAELSEALEQQTATSEVLSVISSSPGNLEPVFATMLENAVRICEASFGNLYQWDGTALRLAANHNIPPAFAEQRRRLPFQPGPTSSVGQAIATKTVVHVVDGAAEQAYTELREPGIVAAVELGGVRTYVAVPLLKEHELIGILTVYRKEVRPFTDKQIELLASFAAQAVIAIENTRLLSELRHSLERQTATSEVLKVISSSPGTLEPVFNAMLGNAIRICEATLGNLVLREGDKFRAVAVHGDQGYVEHWWRNPEFDLRDRPGVPLERAVKNKQIVHVADLRSDQSFVGKDARIVSLVEAEGARTLLVVPMINDGEVVGAIAIYRQEVRPFTDKQIELVTNFAAQAVIAIENTRLLSELRESLERQTATSDVLQVVSSSPGELEPVFNTLLANATKLCEATYGAMWLRDGGVVRNVAFHGELPAAFHDLWHAGSVIPADAEVPVARCIELGKPVYVEDLREHRSYRDGNALARGSVDLAGIRTLVAVPLLKEGGNIGGITIYRREVRPFSEKQIELVTNFAAQAVIAIENTRLLNELRESLEQQTATSEVLKVISSSPGELAPVFESMLENAVRICGAKFGNLFLGDEKGLRIGATHGAPEAYNEFLRGEGVFVPNTALGVGQLVLTKQCYQVADLTAAPTLGDRLRQKTIELAGVRTLVGVPMLKDDKVVGAIVIYRQEVRPFTDKQIELVTNFAAQAVIAIENTRLLSELRESLEQQTATSDVLQVISSSPGELQPVFDSMLDNATRICEAKLGVLLLFEGDAYRAIAVNGDSFYADWYRREPVVDMKEIEHDGTPLKRLTQTKATIHIHDLRDDEAYIRSNPRMKALVESAGARTHLVVPMLKDDRLVGAIVIYRQEVRPFSEKQIALVQNFAAQAVIAIENTRLLNELRESLDQQTATSEVLKVIASSTGELEPVFSAMLANAARLCEARYGALWLRQGENWRAAAMYGDLPPAYIERWRSGSWFNPGANAPMPRAAASREPVHIADMREDISYRGGGSLPVSAVEVAGVRTLLCVPMLRESEIIGVITIYRTEVKPFAEKQVELVKNFGAQAVIAIENARLLNELRQRTDDLTESLEQQTTTAEILGVISKSLDDTQPVFDAIVRSGIRLFSGAAVSIALVEDGMVKAAAVSERDPVRAELWRKRFPFPLTRDYMHSAAILDRAILDVPDVEQAPAELAAGKSNFLASGYRAATFVPLIRGEVAIGALSVVRIAPGPLSDKQLSTLKTYASQALIAIENARLLSELRQRTDDLTESLEQQTATSEVLKVISSAGGELQPVFEVMLENATRLCGAKFGNLYLCEGDNFRTTVMHNVPPAFAEMRMRDPLVRPEPGSMLRQVFDTGKTVQIQDATKEQAYIDRQPRYVTAVELGGFRAMIAVPMLKDGALVGVIIIYKPEAGYFSEKQIALVENFAAQAVIAIENARLLNELRQRTDDLSESLLQQTATSDILQVISNSPTDSQPAFDAIVQSGLKLFPDAAILVALPDGKNLRAAAIAEENSVRADSLLSRWPIPLTREYMHAVAILDRRTIDIPDAMEAPPEFAGGAQYFLTTGYRAITIMPMMRGSEAIGALSVVRSAAGPLSDKQIAVLRTFADQAVIAIENTRLFNELRERTDDLTESLEYQTATSEILTVISCSPTDTQPVFDIIGERAEKLCDADVSVVSTVDGELIQLASIHGVSDEGMAALRGLYPLPLEGETITARTARGAAVVHVADVLADPTYDTKVAALAAGYRACLGVPMMRDGQVIGVVFVGRKEPRPYSDNQVQLLKTFADQAVIAIGNVRLFEEVKARTEDLQESLQQQTATADVLKIISRSAFDLKTVLDTLLRSAGRLCDADMGAITQRKGDKFYRAVAFGLPDEFIERVKDEPVELSRHSGSGRALLEGKVIQIEDVELDPEYTFTPAREFGKFHTLLGVPMLRDGAPAGVLTLMRKQVRPFTQKEIDLVTTFADQAAIAIENVRLFDEVQARTDDLSESLAQQTATADVLKVISRSTFDLQTVLDTLTESAARVCGADKGVIFQRDGDIYRLGANYGFSGEAEEYARAHPIRPGRGSVIGRVALEGKVNHIPDVLADPEYEASGYQETFGFRTNLGVPLLREGETIGVFALTRDEVNPFTDKQIELVTTFADQAVIAIQNVRLFDEVQAQRREVIEALEHQTATSEVLNVISRSPTNAQPVFNAIAESAAHLCDAVFTVVWLYDGDLLHYAANHNFTPEVLDKIMKTYPRRPDRSLAAGRAVLDGKIAYVSDMLADPAYAHELARAGNWRASVAVPMLREGKPIGAISVGKADVSPFTDRQIQLLSIFADQAVIAIGNVRLFDEVQARTDDLAESLAQQTATADVLKVISRSTFDLKTVLDTLLRSAARLCEADQGTITQRVGDKFYRSVAFGYPQEFMDYVKDKPVEVNRDTGTGRALLDSKVTHIPDVEADPDYRWPDAQRLGGYRAMLGVPMLREGEPIGVFTLTRKDARAFTDKQIDLVTTFADQAAIAIENVRLFEEVQKRTEDLAESLAQQTATADVLKVISRSTFDLKTVLQTLVESAARLTEADKANVTRQIDGVFYRAESYGFSAEFMDRVRSMPVEPGRGNVSGRALLEGRCVHIPDLLADPDYTFTEAHQLGGVRTGLGVPMLREGVPIGVLALARNEVRPFTDKQIELVSTFADQPVIAIENVRLFEEIQEKSRQLEEASKHKSQFLANMSHELRTPLNAILGYTELIADGVYGDTPEKVQTTLKRVITNGKHLLGLINDVLDLSKIEAGQLTLSLADYSMKDVVHTVYGAVEPLAAEKKLSFKVEIAPDLPVGHGDERRLTQVLLNLVGNSIKFTDDGNVIIQASLKDGMFCVAVRDTGPGISEDDQKKLFQEFQQADSSTTKKKGGTGLGLAISKRIIEMHGGRIWLDSKLGAGSTFTFMVPVRAEQTKRAA